jgi:hypothetical protein
VSGRVSWLKKSKYAGRSKMVRCKEVKKSRARSVFAYISGLDFFADAADCRFGAACQARLVEFTGEPMTAVILPGSGKSRDRYFGWFVAFNFHNRICQAAPGRPERIGMVLCPADAVNHVLPVTMTHGRRL